MSTSYRLVDLLKEMSSITMIFRQMYNRDFADTLLETAIGTASDDGDTVRDSLIKAFPDNIEATLDAVIEYNSILEQARNLPDNWHQYDDYGPIK